MSARTMQPNGPPARMAALLVLCVTLLAANRISAEPSNRASYYSNDKHGFSLTIPAEVSKPEPLANLADGGLWSSPDGKARLVAVAAPNESGDSLTAYRQFVMQKTYKGANFDYSPVRKTWFVLSGSQGDKTFYERITFACNGRYIYGWQLVYPSTEKVRYDRVVEAIHRSYRIGRRPDGGCQ